MYALYYGPCTSSTFTTAQFKTSQYLGRDVLAAWYAEHGPNGIRFDARDTDRKTAAARRNSMAAMLCSVLVVIGRPKYAQAIVRTFRHRGRRVLWYNRTTQQITEPEPNVNRQHMGKEATWEPTLWQEQHAERMRSIDEYLYQHPESLRTPDSIPTYGWTETATDTDADAIDICEHTKKQDRLRAEKEWKQRAEEHKGPVLHIDHEWYDCGGDDPDYDKTPNDYHPYHLLYE